MDDQKFYGVYPAICKDVKDPEKRYRIRVECEQVFGSKSPSNWAEACLPVTDNANHPDHQPHTAAQIAALLTTDTETVSDPQGGSITIPALTVKAKTSGTLKHAHVTYSDKQDEGGNQEHTLHRKIPRVNQVVWIMFIGGNPDLPVWIGVGK